MIMGIYADHPDRRASQIIGDVVALLWCTASVIAGSYLNEMLRRLTDTTGSVEDTGASLATSLGDAADTIDNVPFVGESVASALQRAADAAGGLRDAGSSATDFVENTATALGIGVPALALVLALVVWLRPRIQWFREAQDARAALRLPDGIELLAARSAAKVRLPRLAEYGPRLVQRWKVGDAVAAEAMARAELDRLGLAYHPAGVER